MEIAQINQRIAVLNADSKRINNDRAVSIGKKETLQKQMNDALAAYKAKYGVELTEANLQSEIDRVSAEKLKEVEQIESVLNLIKLGQYDEANALVNGTPTVKEESTPVQEVPVTPVVEQPQSSVPTTPVQETTPVPPVPTAPAQESIPTPPDLGIPAEPIPAVPVESVPTPPDLGIPTPPVQESVPTPPVESVPTPPDLGIPTPPVQESVPTPPDLGLHEPPTLGTPVATPPVLGTPTESIPTPPVEPSLGVPPVAPTSAPSGQPIASFNAILGGSPFKPQGEV